MERINHSTAETDKFGVGKDGFTEGTPPTIPATVVTDDVMNAVQEELCGVVEGVGASLVVGERDQVMTIIKSALAQIALSSSNKAEYTIGGTPAFNAVAAAENRDMICAVGSDGANDIAAYSYSGKTFIKSTGLGAATALKAVAYDNAANAVAVGSSGQIAVSANGGKSWTIKSAAGAYAGQFRCIAYDETNDEFWAAGDTGEIQVSADSGATWTSKKSGAQVFTEIAAENGNIIVFDSGSNLYYSSNSGSTWTNSAPPGSTTVTDLIYDADTSLFYLTSYDSGTHAASEVYSSSGTSTWTLKRDIHAELGGAYSSADAIAKVGDFFLITVSSAATGSASYLYSQTRYLFTKDFSYFYNAPIPRPGAYTGGSATYRENVVFGRSKIGFQIDYSGNIEYTAPVIF